MKQEFVCKADALLEDQEIEDAQIVISGKLPDFGSMEHADCFYNEQAQKIHSILFNHVAQGVRSRLLILLMQSMQSAYKGRYYTFRDWWGNRAFAGYVTKSNRPRKNRFWKKQLHKKERQENRVGEWQRMTEKE